MSSSVDSRNRGLAAASKRAAVSASPITATTGGVFTLPAGFLDSLQVGDVVQLSGLSGGSAYAAGQDYYLVGALVWPAGHTTVQLSAALNGDPISGGTAITNGTITHGKLTAAADGVLAGSHGPSPSSPRGR